MKTAESLAELSQLYGIEKAVLAFGVFDGVHRGHRKIISRLSAVAGQLKATPVVVTFEPHPRIVLQPDQAPFLLTPTEQKLRILSDIGVDATVILPFTAEFANLLPEDFVAACLLADGLTVPAICVGKSWRFGRRGEGNTQSLAELGKKHAFHVEALPEFLYYGVPVSNTRIRVALAAGRLDHAARMLGRPCTVVGTVSHGRGVGKQTFQCPTANLSDGRIQLPRKGVYAGRACFVEAPGKALNGIVYVGNSPTLKDTGRSAPRPPVVEIHLLDVHQDLYGRQMEIQFCKFIREDCTFPSLEALKCQIQNDLCKVKELFAAGL